MTEPLELGQSQGWRFWPNQEAGIWHWFAFTERGTENGDGTSPENCMAQIEAALLRLRNG